MLQRPGQQRLLRVQPALGLAPDHAGAGQVQHLGPHGGGQIVVAEEVARHHASRAGGVVVSAGPAGPLAPAASAAWPRMAGQAARNSSAWLAWRMSGGASRIASGWTALTRNPARRQAASTAAA